MSNILQDPISNGYIDTDSFYKGGCRSSWTCSACGIEYIMDSGKAEKGLDTDKVKYVYGPCTCGTRCPCQPEIKYELINKPIFIASKEERDLLNVLKIIPEDAHISIGKKDNKLQLSYVRPYPNSSGIFFREYNI